MLFINYLKDRYGTVEKLNNLWGTGYASFDEIQLPVTRPETQPEHALWEDWTKYREWYRYHYEMLPSITAVQRYAPELLYLTWSTNYLIERSPASGINFYEYGKALYEHPKKFKINGFEHANTENKEWFTFDINSMFSRNCTAEWGAFYFPPATHQQKTDLLTETLWNGIVNGQVGWELFQFSTAGGNAANYFDMCNLPLPLGWQLVLLSSDFQKTCHLFLDGKREEPLVRIVYSLTNQRHTCWPEAEGDISYRAVGGLYDYFKRIHLHARAIDEQAVWEGYLPEECKLLILPEIAYETGKLYESVLKYLENGGSVLVTQGTGRYDEYGRRRDGWFALAGVKPVKVAEKIINLGEGLRYFSAANENRMMGLLPVFADETDVLVRYADNTPVLTRTVVGKGNLFILGLDLGQDCGTQWAGRPEVVSALLEPVFRIAGIEKETVLNVQRISVRPWTYKGKRFLVLTDPRREDFQDFKMSLKGNWKVKDYILGREIPASYDSGYTVIDGLISSPGGLILSMEKGGTVSRDAMQSVEPSVPEKSGNLSKSPGQENAGISLDEKTPFEGRIWVDRGIMQAGEFAIDLDVDTAGGWGGQMYMTVSYGKEKQRRRCIKDETLVFEFTDRRLTVNAKDITSVYPGNLLCRIEVSRPETIFRDCTVRNEDFFGRKSIVMSNGLVSVRLLPELGGRMIEFLSLPDMTNHLASDAGLLRQGAAGTGYSDWGGIEENAGGWPGPFWNAPFRATVLEEGPECAKVRLEMDNPIEWAYGYANPKSGKNRLVKEFVLRKGLSRVEILLKNYNESKEAMSTGLRTHPKFRTGGDADPSDTWMLKQKEGLVSSMFPFAGHSLFPAESGWTSLVDVSQKMAMVQSFNPDAVESVYMCPGKDGYNMELWLKPVDIPAGGALEFRHSLSLIRGLSGVAEYADDAAAYIEMVSGDTLAAGQPLEFNIETGSDRQRKVRIDSVISGSGRVIKEFKPESLDLKPGRAVSRNFTWDPSGIKDGSYTVNVRISGEDGNEIMTLEKVFSLVGESAARELERLSAYAEEIKKMHSLYGESRKGKAAAGETEKLRTRIVCAEILLDELRGLVLSGEKEKAGTTEKMLKDILESR